MEKKLPSKYALMLADLHNKVIEIQDNFDTLKRELYEGECEEDLEGIDPQDLEEEVDNICDTLDNLESETSNLDYEYNSTNCEEDFEDFEDFEETPTINHLKKEQLLQLRKEIVLDSVLLKDYSNSLGIDQKAVYDFFMGYVDYLTELGDKDFELDTEENLIQYYCDTYEVIFIEREEE